MLKGTIRAVPIRSLEEIRIRFTEIKKCALEPVKVNNRDRNSCSIAFDFPIRVGPRFPLCYSYTSMCFFTHPNTIQKIIGLIPIWIAPAEQQHNRNAKNN